MSLKPRIIPKTNNCVHDTGQRLKADLKLLGEIADPLGVKTAF